MEQGEPSRRHSERKRKKDETVSGKKTFSATLLEALQDAGVSLLNLAGVWNRADTAIALTLIGKLTPVSLYCVHPRIKVVSRDSRTGVIEQIGIGQFVSAADIPFVNLALQAMARPRTYLVFDNTWIPIDPHERQGDKLYLGTRVFSPLREVSAPREKILTELFQAVKGATEDDVTHMTSALSALSKTGRDAADEHWSFLASLVKSDVAAICSLLEERPNSTPNSFRLVADSVIGYKCAASTIDEKLSVLAKVPAKTRSTLLGMFKLPKPAVMLSSYRGFSSTGNPNDLIAAKVFTELKEGDFIACFPADAISSLSDLNKIGAQKAKFYPVAEGCADLKIHTSGGNSKTSKSVLALSYGQLGILRSLTTEMPATTDGASRKTVDAEVEDPVVPLPDDAVVVGADETFDF